MKIGDFVQVDYVGRVKETGDVFDLTREDVAKEENIYNPKIIYKPVVLIVGADFIIKGLSAALEEMKVGDKKKIEISPEDAYGDRKEDMIKMIPESRFKEHGLDPVPGAVVNIGMLRGVIMTSSSGRVKVDFNHPLAGKTLEYDIEIKSQLDEQEDKIKSIISYFTGVEEVDVRVDGKSADVEIKERVDLPRQAKQRLADVAKTWTEIEKLRFIEEVEGLPAPETQASKNDADLQ